MAGGARGRQGHPGTGACGAHQPTEGKRQLIWGEGLVARISNDYEPQLPVVHSRTGSRKLLRDCPVTRDGGSAGYGGFRLPCSDSDDSDDDVLSIGPLRPVETAAPLGGAEGHDDEVLQINPRNEWSVNSWTADDSCGYRCC